MEFKDKLKYIRGVLLISQTKLAQYIGVSYSTINRLENGKNLPNYITQMRLEKLCKEKSITFEE